MTENEWLAEEFEENRARLRAMAYRMLGSTGEADDAVQEAWLRLSRAGGDGVDNLGGWLTTVVARVCLDMLRSRESRREDPLDANGGVADVVEALDPEQEAMLGDSVGLAMLVVLDTLSPPERLAFVLHDMFGVPFEDIGPIVGRSPEAARQLASRARRRVRGARASGDADVARRLAVVDAFLAASREGDFGALVALLDPDAVYRADPAAVAMGSDAELRGASAVAGQFAGRAEAARLAFVDGAPALVWSHGGKPRAVFAFTLDGDRVSAIDLVMEPERLARFAIEHV